MAVRRYFFRGDGSEENFDLDNSEVTLVDCQFQTGLSDAFEDCSDVFDFLINCSVVIAAIPTSKFWAHWSASMTVSKYSPIKLENADKPN